MQAEGVGLDGLSGSVIERYLAQRRAAGYVEYRSMKALRPLLDYLAPLGVLPIPQEVPPDPVEELLGRYRAWLLVERGVTPGNGARLRGLRAAVRREPGARRRAGSGRADRGRCHRVRAGRLSGPGGRVGEADRLRAAVAAAVAAPDRHGPGVAGGRGPVGGGLAAVGPAEGPGTGSAAPAAGRL